MTTNRIREMAGGRERILVVDDEPAIRELCRTLLETLGYTVTTAAGPVQAHNLFAENPEGYDLVLTDLRMQPVTGAQLACRISDLRPETPIIAHTSETARFYTHFPVRKLVKKPASLRVLAAAVRDVLDESEVPALSC